MKTLEINIRDPFVMLHRGTYYLCEKVEIGDSRIEIDELEKEVEKANPDVDFDALGEESIKSITVSGIRCQDMRLRMKYVGIRADLEPDVEKAVRKKAADGVKNLYVLVNYTALFDTRNILKRLEEGKE